MNKINGIKKFIIKIDDGKYKYTIFGMVFIQSLVTF